MAAERFVLLGLAQVRSSWFREVSRWAVSTSLPMEFVKAMSLEEVQVRLRSGRGYSALLIDDSIVGFDRDLVGLALESGCAVLVVDSGRATRDWSALGATAVLPATFDRDELLQVLHQFATPVVRTSTSTTTVVSTDAVAGYRGHVVAVTGPGGTGRSTLAMAIAQGLAADPRNSGLVCLADLALHADQAMLHDARDVVPGIVELVEAHRAGTPTVEAIRSITWLVRARGYHLLLGLRRHRDWTSVRPRAFDAALDGLRRGFRVVVADIDDDVEGERDSGSLDVEERNAMARTVASTADVVVVVGVPGMQGVHAMLRVTRDLLELGVAGARILPLVNRSPRSPRARAELTRAFGDLLVGAPGSEGVPSPIHLAERRRLDELLRDGARLPDAWLAPACGPVHALLEAVGHPGDDRSHRQPVAVAPGSLGAWTQQEPDQTPDPGGR